MIDQYKKENKEQISKGRAKMVSFYNVIPEVKNHT